MVLRGGKRRSGCREIPSTLEIPFWDWIAQNMTGIENQYQVRAAIEIYLFPFRPGGTPARLPGRLVPQTRPRGVGFRIIVTLARIGYLWNHKGFSTAARYRYINVSVCMLSG